MQLKYIFFYCNFILTCSLFSQADFQEIRLIDMDDALPIIGASFHYGSQQGVSDKDGLLRFNYVPGQSMEVSHINYGPWTWDDEKILHLIQDKISYRRSISVNLYPVTVIAVRPTSKPDDKVTIDYQERMEHDAAAILNQIPAFNSIRKGGNYGFDPVFRGFKYDQLNVVMDGAQSATAACPNRMDPPTSQMAPNMMDRIEVLKGPHALRYGAGFGATINFVPFKLKFTSQPDIYGRVSTGYAENGNVVRGETQLGFSSSQIDWSIFGSWSQGDDYQSGNGEEVAAEFSRGSFGTNLGLKLSPKQQLRISALYNRARDAEFPALPMDLRKDDTWLFNVKHNIQFTGEMLQSLNTTFFGSIVDHRMDNLLKSLNPRMLNAKTLAETYNLGGRTEGIWNIGKGKFFGGADLRIEGAQGIRTREFLRGPNTGKIFNDNAWQSGEIVKTGLFGEYHYQTSLFKYVLSGRLEFNNADIDDPSNEFTQVYSDVEIQQINPSISLGILHHPGNSSQIGLWLGRAQRSGGLVERFINYFPVGQDPYEMLGNPQLNSETNNQIDLSFQWRTSNTRLNVDLFASYLQDFISSIIVSDLNPRLPMSPGVRQFINIDEAIKTGFEISWSQKLGAGLQQQVGLAYSYAQDLEREDPLPEIAPLDIRYGLIGNYFRNKVRPELVFRYVTEQSRISSEYGETVTPSFALVDLKLGYILTDQWRINAGINNLFGENYYEHLSRSVRGTSRPIFAPGRNLFVNVSWVF